jgi:zinc protease
MRKHLLVLVLLVATTTPLLAAKSLHPRHRRLANGLDVYSLEDHSTPLVAVEVWYRVGARDDPPERGGFAHLFEHLMFKATAHMTDEMIPRLVDDAGGTNNASTDKDVTRYHEVVPSNYLRTILWAEADRMMSLRVDQTALDTEREVVKDEYRTSVLADPYGRFDLLIDSRSFAVHPDKRPIIGSIEELDAATLEEVQAFHRMYYRPDNAILVVVGDFDPRELDRYVDRYFAPIPKSATPIVRQILPEPPRTENRTFVEHAPNVPLPAVAMTWLVPPPRHPDFATLDVAWAILYLGSASWLSTDLIHDSEVAHEAEALLNYYNEHGLFAVNVKLATGRTPEEGLTAIRDEINDLLDRSSAASLRRAKRQLVNSRLGDLETNEGKAMAIAYGVLYMNDPADASAELRRIDAVTLRSLRRVVKRYLVDGRSVSITYLPEESQ